MIPVVWLIVAVALFVAAFVYMDWRHMNERRDLYNRIMARDFAEYRVASNNNVARTSVRNPVREAIERAQRDID